jgi:hypothetical protein
MLSLGIISPLGATTSTWRAQKKIIEFKALKGGESLPAKVPANVAFVEIATDKADVDYDVNGTKGTVKAGQSAEVAVKPGQTVTVTAKGDTNVTLTFLVRPLFKLVIFERDKKDKPGEKEWLLGIVDCKAPSPKECEELAKDFANASLLIQNGQIQLFNFSGPPDAAIGNGAIYFDTQANPATGDPPNTPYFWDDGKKEWVPLRGLKCWDLRRQDGRS